MPSLDRFQNDGTLCVHGYDPVTDTKIQLIVVFTLETTGRPQLGFGPVIAGTDALTRDRLAHVDQYYLRPDCYRGVNAVLIDAQAEIGLAQLFGGGLVAAVDGMRFVVPIRSVDARPNPKYFARKRGVT